MICSLQEIGISSNVVPKAYENGILSSQLKLSRERMLYLTLYLNDQVMEFDLTPNRADALSMVGTAYEVAKIISN